MQSVLYEDSTNSCLCASPSRKRREQPDERSHYWLKSKIQNMYYPNDIEEICYDQAHIEQVWGEICKTIPNYFQKYIDTEGGHSIEESEMALPDPG